MTSQHTSHISCIPGLLAHVCASQRGTGLWGTGVLALPLHLGACHSQVSQSDMGDPGPRGDTQQSGGGRAGDGEILGCKGNCGVQAKPGMSLFCGSEGCGHWAFLCSSHQSLVKGHHIVDWQCPPLLVYPGRLQPRGPGTEGQPRALGGKPLQLGEDAPEHERNPGGLGGTTVSTAAPVHICSPIHPSQLTTGIHSCLSPVIACTPLSMMSVHLFPASWTSEPWFYFLFFPSCALYYI